MSITLYVSGWLSVGLEFRESFLYLPLFALKRLSKDGVADPSIIGTRSAWLR